MWLTMKAKDLLVYDQVKDWMKTYNAKDKMNNIRRIAFYLKWRKITFEELMNSENEEKYFQQMIKEFTDKGSKSYGIAITTVVRSFMRFCGLNVKAKHQLNETWHYENDPIMKKFLKVFRAKATKKSANISLNDYCLYRGLTPSELETENKSEVDLTFILLDFKDDLLSKKNIQEDTAWRKVNTIKKFYRVFKKHRIEFEDSVKYKPTKMLYSDKREEQITKEEMKKMLEVADVRDNMILLALWESGLNSSDLTSITYGQIKQFLNLENPDKVPNCAIFKHVRKKYPIQFFCVLGKQTLKYVSLWLKQRINGLIADKEILTDTSIIFSTKSVPFTKPNSRTINNITKRISELAGIRLFVPSDFRNTFYTKLKETGMDKDTREMLMGHTLGIAGHYIISNEEHYQEEYLKYYDVCFDLTFDNEKIQSLEEENREIKKALKNVSNVLENFFSALTDPEKGTNITREDFEEALRRLRKIE